MSSQPPPPAAAPPTSSSSSSQPLPPSSSSSFPPPPPSCQPAPGEEEEQHQQQEQEEVFYQRCRASYLWEFRSSLNNISSEQQLGREGEKMTAEEIRAVFSIADVNKDGKLDYAESARCWAPRWERCRSKALERLEADAKIKRQNFGSQMDGHMTAAAAPLLPPEPHRPGSDPPLKKEGRTLSRGSSARSRRSSLSSNAVTMATSGSKASGKTLEPAALQDWQHGAVRGCFFVEEEGTITSLQYGLHLPQRSSVYLSIHPLSLDHRTPDPSACSWMAVDTALFLTYFLLPFTSGCRLRRRRSHTATPPTTKPPPPLVYRTDTGELDLTRELREALSDVFDVIDLDGNGLISLEEYNLFEQRTSGEKCDQDAWAICKETFDTRRNQLTRQGFMELHLMEASEKDEAGAAADLWLTLEAMGYDRDLQLVEALQRSIVSSGAELRALGGHDNVLLYTYRGQHRVSVLVANKVLQHVLPTNETQDWTYCCVETCLPGH
ncbi:hypothetical protein CRUP_002324 [Coryphaenoides rupestris]|nr:hypothetical protein CRUP_002324 [Coryphaenoides rupestris]